MAGRLRSGVGTCDICDLLRPRPAGRAAAVMPWWSRLLAALGLEPRAANARQAEHWQANYDARSRYFEREVGPLPGDILKMLSMTGVWPGGGLFAIPAPRLGNGLAVYTTFGLSNPDMPTTVRMVDFALRAEEGMAGGGRASSARGRLEKKAAAPKRSGAAGYGYEVIVVAPAGRDWPVNLLQWAVNAEVAHDADLLGKVERHGGLTVERIDVGEGEPVHLLIAMAQPPLPLGTTLPAGTMHILVATTITEPEMAWSMQHGRLGLLEALRASGVGQISQLGRADCALPAG